MSEDVLSIIPTDPWWQPDPATGERAVALVRALEPGDPDGAHTWSELTWHEAVAPVDCGANLERIGCPHCGATVDIEWYAHLLEEHGEGGFTTLAVEVPCCGTATSLDALQYEWPCGFARFEIAVWNPERTWFTDDDLTAVAAALGHPVRQIRARV